jgi:hypothetical protein
MKLTRIVICAKDIQRITGRTDSYGRRLLRRMRKHFKKAEHQFITVEEFCQYNGLKEEDVVKMLD